MSDVEFFYTSNNRPLHFDSEEDRFVWRQYTGDWYVRVSDPDVKSVFIRIEGNDFPLEKYISEDCFTLSKNVGEDITQGIEAKTGQKLKFGGWVALLDLWSSNGKGISQQLHPPLYIEPGNLSPDDFDLIINRLQELAFFRYSPTRVEREVSGGSTEGGIDNDEDELLKQAANKFLALIKLVHLNWPLVLVTASRETQLLPKLVDVSSAAGSHSSRLVAKAAQHPYARRVEILMPQESFATVENQFLVYVMQEIHQRAPLFNSRLTMRCKELRKEWEASEDKEVQKRQSKSEWKKKQTEQYEMANYMEELAKDITKVAKEVAPYINDPVLHEVLNRPLFPSRPTDRLTRSFAYGPIYNAFYDYRNQPGISFAPLKSGLMRALDTKAIHPACTLYELWVFVEIYNMLIHTFGFRLTSDTPTGHPLDFVDSAAGEIIGDTLKDREFRLEMRPTNNEKRIITVSLFYDTQRRTKKGSYLRPDLFMRMTETASGGIDKVMTFAVDAKYHSYPGFYMKSEREKYGVDTVFDLDLLITAKDKYRDALGCDAAFVVHSDGNKKYTYWGGNPYEQNENWPMDHHYGAIFSTPSDTNNLRRLLKCCLMYHMGIENVCWSCRSEVESTDKFIDDPTAQIQFENGIPVGTSQVPGEQRLAGRNYICTNCSRSWHRTWCSNPKAVGEHKILKLGLDNFHLKDAGFVVCPACGNGARDEQKDIREGKTKVHLVSSS